MLAPRLAAVGAAAAALLVGAPGASIAAEPPNGNDPCSRAGRNTCGTLGVGSYTETRYGIRWLGDFRGALPGDAGEEPAFCVDLGFWYASPEYRYRPETGPFRNREGELVPLEARQKIAYALWRYGRSAERGHQAAVALYVHSLVGDARPGEVDAGVLDAARALYRRIARDSARYHGPYRIDVRLAGPLVVAEKTVARVRVVSADGNAVPGVPLRLAARARSAPHALGTNASGVAVVPLAPARPGAVRLSVATGPLASTLPAVFRPTAARATANGQRLAVPRSQRLATSITFRAKRRLEIATTALRKASRWAERAASGSSSGQGRAGGAGSRSDSTGRSRPRRGSAAPGSRRGRGRCAGSAARSCGFRPPGSDGPAGMRIARRPRPMPSITA